MRRLLLISAVALSSLAAHEVSLQQSTVDFLADGTWHLAMSTDPMVLLAPEARAAGADPRAAWAAMGADERASRLERARSFFADNVIVRFDGAVAAARVSLPAAENVADPIDRLVDGVALSGRVPPGAKTFTVSTTQHIGPMVLIPRRETDDDEPTTLAVVSGGTSAPFALERDGAAGRIGDALRPLGAGAGPIAAIAAGAVLALGLVVVGVRLGRRRAAARSQGASR